MRVPPHNPQSSALYAAIIARPGHYGPRKLAWRDRVVWAEQVAQLRGEMMWRGDGRTTILRMPRKPHTTVLTPTQVQAIRNAMGTHKAIGARFGVSATTVCRIKNFRAWKNV